MGDPIDMFGRGDKKEPEKPQNRGGRSGGGGGGGGGGSGGGGGGFGGPGKKPDFIEFLKKLFAKQPETPSTAAPPPQGPPSGIRRYAKFAALGFFLLYAFLSTCLVYIRPDEYGVKVVKLGLDRGVHKEIYGAGWHFVLPGVVQMHKLPRDVQALEMSSVADSIARFARQEKSAHIQTSDGFFVDVDVSILYRLVDPYKVFTTVGPGRLYEENGIIPKAEPVLKEMLGVLTTEDFYNSELRVKQTHKARERLNQEVEAKGLKVDHILVRYFRYSPEIQRNIEERKLKDQLVFKNQAEAKAAIEGAKLKKAVQEGEALVTVKLSEGDAYVTKRQAERELYMRSKHAEADLLIKLAEARKTELRNTALQGFGSDRMVGLKMAEALSGLETIILPSDGKEGMNPLNMTKTLELFGVKKGESR